MLDLSTLKKIDSKGMFETYDKWPQFARDAYESQVDPITFDDIDHIVFSGMGGSGAIGDLFSAILSKTNIHVNVVKGYVLPKTVDKNTLVVTTSISGDTSETLSILQSAAKMDCKSISFSSGGKMKLFCEKNNTLFREIPKIHSPRASFVTFAYSILHSLNSILPIQKNHVMESLDKLDEQSEKISSENLNDNISINLANFLHNQIPCIYYPNGLSAAAIRFKNSLQENSKTHAFIEDVIEACHNGIVSWENPSKICPVLIKGTDDHIKTKERWSILEEYFDSKKIPYQEINTVDGNILSKLVCLIHLLDFSSIYLAVLSGIDPSPVKSIDFVKTRL